MNELLTTIDKWSTSDCVRLLDFFSKLPEQVLEDMLLILECTPSQQLVRATKAAPKLRGYLKARGAFKRPA